jgi:hypothetical protein
MLHAVMKADETTAEWIRDLKSLSDADQRLTSLFEVLDIDTDKAESIKTNSHA